jgi:hypothetical protein
MSNQYGANDGIKIGEGSQSTPRKPSALSLCPLHIRKNLGSNTDRLVFLSCLLDKFATLQATATKAS